MSTKIITAEEAANLFPKNGKRQGVSVETIRKALVEGKLGGRKFGSIWFTTEEAVIAWLTRVEAK